MDKLQKDPIDAMLPDLPHPAGYPVDAATKAWIDARASWLLDQFGWERVTNCKVVLPTPQFFPGGFHETEADARAMLQRLCGFMAVDPRSVELELFEEAPAGHGGGGPLGVYEEYEGRYRVWIEAQQLHRPLGLAATIAHELGHIHLLGQGRVTEDTDDHEPLTDLLTVFFGLGVMTANEALHDTNWQAGGWEGWQIGQHGYLTMPMFGYALALFARIRDETRPAWARHLRPDVRSAFSKSVRVLARHGMPELRFVQTTMARPTRVQSQKTENIDDTEDETPWPEPDSDVPQCTFCGVEFSDRSEDGICDDCQQSIDENQQELLREREQAVAAAGWRRRVFRWSCLLLCGVMFLLIVLDWLRAAG